MITNEHMIIEQSAKLSGTTTLFGAKNAVLVIMASTILTSGKSIFYNVPASTDVLHMISLLESLGAYVIFNRAEHILYIDSTCITKWRVCPDIMKKMRASILVMGPLLARFGKAEIALPGGCLIGARPIDYHINNFKRLGTTISSEHNYLKVNSKNLQPKTIVLEYPSVGATENIVMIATCIKGTTTIINAALEPEVLDLIHVLKQMGAHIEVQAPATIIICGGRSLYPVEHEIVPDRLEAGALFLAAAITGGEITLRNARARDMDVFLLKLEQMGHRIEIDENGITLRACQEPQAVSFKTSPYPGFPTDLQAPMMAAQCLAQGKAVIEETVFENRLVHVRELQKMGAQIDVDHTKAIVTGVDELYGASVIASDIRASCALALAGLAAKGTTIMTGLHHWRRGYEHLETKLNQLGATIQVGYGKQMPVLQKANRLVKELE